MKYLIVTDFHRYVPEKRELIFYDANSIYCILKFVKNYCKNKIEKMYNISEKRERYKEYYSIFRNEFYYSLKVFMWLLQTNQFNVYLSNLKDEVDLAVSVFLFELCRNNYKGHFERAITNYICKYESDILEFTYEIYKIPDNIEILKDYKWSEYLLEYSIYIKVYFDIADNKVDEVLIILDETNKKKRYGKFESSLTIFKEFNTFHELRSYIKRTGKEIKK